MHLVLHVIHHISPPRRRCSGNHPFYAFIFFYILSGIVAAAALQESVRVRRSVHCLRFLSVVAAGREGARLRVTSEIIGVRMCENVLPAAASLEATSTSVT